MPQHLRTTLATAAATALAAGLLTAVTGTAAAADHAAPAANGRQGDFNGDGYRDLAVAAPSATVDGKKGAGAVTVLYGSAHGVDASRRTTLTQNSPGVPGAAEAGDLFGASLATGDFNSDGFADLAVSAPYEDISTDADAGTVQILWAPPAASPETAASPSPTRPPRSTTASARRWPPATSTVTARPTSRSARPPRRCTSSRAASAGPEPRARARPSSCPSSAGPPAVSSS